MEWAGAAFGYNRWDETLSHSRAGLQIARTTGDAYLEVDPRFLIAEVLIRRARLAEARELVMSSLRIAETLRDAVWMSAVHMQLAELYYNLGDWQGCRASAQRSLESPAQRGFGFAHAAFFLMELLTGNLEEAERILGFVKEQARAAPDPAHSMPAYVASMVAAWAAVTGDLEDLPVAEALARAAIGSESIPPSWALAARGALTLVAFLRNDAVAAEPLYRDQSWFMPGVAEGSFIEDGALGLLAETLGLMDEAVSEFRSSRERMRHFLPVYAWETYDLARALRKRGAAGDREEARKLLQEAVHTAEERGMPPIGEHARAELARLEASEHAYPDGLTPREAEILRLVAAGRMDKEIAYELHITVKTASNHVGNIFRKIGAGNRTEAARVRHAARAGQVSPSAPVQWIPVSPWSCPRAWKA